MEINLLDENLIPVTKVPECMPSHVQVSVATVFRPKCPRCMSRINGVADECPGCHRRLRWARTDYGKETEISDAVTPESDIEKLCELLRADLENRIERPIEAPPLIAPAKPATNPMPPPVLRRGQ